MPITLETLWDQAEFRPNRAQQRAIRHLDGPLYLTAGPGSGKTSVLVWRTLNLIVFHGVAPERIFLGTFTEKGAHQLKERLRALLAMVTAASGVPYVRLSITYQQRIPDTFGGLDDCVRCEAGDRCAGSTPRDGRASS